MGYPRLFLAIPVSGDIRACFLRLRKELQSRFEKTPINWTASENLHLTLHYFGNVSIEEYARIEPRVDRVLCTCPRFDLTFDKAALFPSVNRPRIIACEIETNKTLENLVADLRKELTPAVRLPQARPFRGHVTLGRFKGLPATTQTGENGLSRRQRMAVALEPFPAKTGPVMNVGEVALFNSTTRADGPVYEVVKHWRLRESANR